MVLFYGFVWDSKLAAMLVHFESILVLFDFDYVLNCCSWIFD